MRFSFMQMAQRFFLRLGIGVLIYVVASVAYADIYQRYQSSKFDDKLDTLTLDFTKGITTPDAPPDLRDGAVIGRIEIPHIGMSVMVFQGVNQGSLRVGAGHVPGTPLPGANGNSSIAAHRDTFFRGLKDIRTGDRIQFSTTRGTFEYFVTTTEIVEPEQTGVMDSRGYSELTLITCYPFYYVGPSPRRFIVHARPNAIASIHPSGD